MAEKKLKLLFFGTSAFAVESLCLVLKQKSIECLGIVTQPDRSKGRGLHVYPSPMKRFCFESGISCFQPESLQYFKPVLEKLSPEIGLVVAYGKILPKWLFNSQKYFSQGLYNIHASLLPRYRGAAPIHRALMSGDEETGLSIQKMVPELDAGPVWFSIPTPILLEDTLGSLEAKLAKLLPEVIQRFARQFPPSIKEMNEQSSIEVSYAPKLGANDWQVHIDRGLPSWFHLRAFMPEPGVWLQVDGSPLLRICELSYGGRTGQGIIPLVLRTPNQFILRCQDGHQAHIKVVQMPGKTKQIISTWVNGQQKLLNLLSEKKLLTIE